MKAYKHLVKHALNRFKQQNNLTRMPKGYVIWGTK